MPWGPAGRRWPVGARRGGRRPCAGERHRQDRAGRPLAEAEHAEEAEVHVQHVLAGEAIEEVLAVRLDALEPLTVDQRCPGGEATLRRGDVEAPAGQHPALIERDPMDRVTFGHGWCRAQTRASGAGRPVAPTSSAETRKIGAVPAGVVVCRPSRRSARRGRRRRSTGWSRRGRHVIRRSNVPSGVEAGRLTLVDDGHPHAAVGVDGQAVGVPGRRARTSRRWTRRPRRTRRGRAPGCRYRAVDVVEPPAVGREPDAVRQADAGVERDRLAGGVDAVALAGLAVWWHRTGRRGGSRRRPGRRRR